MEINLGDEKIVELVGPYSADQIRDKASAKRVDAFGAVARLIQRPKFEDIDITTIQKRYEPFWYATATARYVYDRRRTYSVEVSPEVQAVTVHEHEHTAAGERVRAFQVEGIEHCVEETKSELLLDAERGQEADLGHYLKFAPNIVADVAALQQGDTLVVLPEVRASFVVRKLVSPLLKTFHADKIHEERIDVAQVALFYRPVYAVEYLWKAKEKRQVLEFDGLTGEARAAAGEIKKQVARILENDALFDIGADAIGTVLPGASIAVKLGRLAARKAVH